MAEPSNTEGTMPGAGDEAAADERRIWRYMDFAKFVWLLSKESLWFTRADSFEDKWEAFCTVTPYEPSDKPHPLQKAVAEYACSELAQLPAHTFVNSWSLARHESYLMWRAYTPNGIGVAVQSTTGRLRASIRDSAPLIEFGEVEYHPEADLIRTLRSEYDFRRQARAGYGYFLRPSFLKRSFFSAEHEWRAAFGEEKETAAGVAVRVDISVLIESVFIPIIAGEYFREAVDSVLEKYGKPRGLCLRSHLSGLASQPPSDPALKPLPKN